jgi:hypothetical protein
LRVFWIVTGRRQQSSRWNCVLMELEGLCRFIARPAIANVRFPMA